LVARYFSIPLGKTNIAAHNILALVVFVVPQSCHHFKESIMNQILQLGLLDRRISSLGLVVALHICVFVMLFTAVKTVPVMPTRQPPIHLTPLSEPPPIVRPRQQQAANAAKQADVRPTSIVNDDLPRVDVESPIIASDELPSNLTQTLVPAQMPTGSNTIGTPSPDISVACPNIHTVQAAMRYPLQARREGVQGDVVVQFVLTANGAISQSKILSSSNSLLNRAALNAVQQFQCLGQGREMIVEAPFAFRLAE
jgi:periplasmic protein TonB